MTMKLTIDPCEGIRIAGGNRAFYLRMLLRFPDDPTFTRLEDALSRGDVSDAYLQAHTLKGLCAQLALPLLYEQTDALCALLRAQEEGCLCRAGAMMMPLARAYRAALEAIASLTSACTPDL